MDIDNLISKNLDDKLKKKSLDVNPAVMETEKKLIPPELDLNESESTIQNEVEDTSIEEINSDTKTIAERVDETQKAIADLQNIAKRYGFRPFSEASSAVTQRFSELKSGIDLIV